MEESQEFVTPADGKVGYRQAVNRPLVQTNSKAPSRRFGAKEKKGSSSPTAKDGGKKLSATKTYKLVLDGGKNKSPIERDPAKEALSTVKKLNERIDQLEAMMNIRFEQVQSNQEESRLQSLRDIE